MLKRFCIWIMSHRLIVLGVGIFFTVLFASELAKLEVKTIFTDLIPKKHPFMKTHLQYQDQLGDPFKVFMMLRVKEGDIYNFQTLNKIKRITNALDLIPGVNHNQIYSIASRKVKKVTVTSDAIDTEDFMKKVPTTQAELEEVKENVRKFRNIFGVWVSRDEKSVFFTAGFIESLMDYNHVNKKIEEIISRETDPNHVLYAAGEPLLAAAIHSKKNQIYFILALSVSGIILTIYLYFKNLVGTVVPVTCGLLCSIWGLGFAGLIGDNIDPLGLVIPLLISARALSHSVQMTERYFEEYHVIGDVKESIISAMYKNIPPGAVGIATDCLGILLIAVAPIPLIRKLGFVGAFWAGSNVFSGLIFTPVMLSFFKPPKNIPDIVDIETGKAEKVIDLMAKAVSGRNCYFTFAVIVLIAIFSGYYGSKVKLGDVQPGSSILWPDSFYNTSIDQIDKNFSGMDELSVIVEGEIDKAVQAPAYLKLLDSFQGYMERCPKVGGTQSIADLLPPIHKNIYGGYPKWQTLPAAINESAQIFYLLTGGAAPGDYNRYFTEDQKNANVVILYKDHMGSTIREAIALVKKFIEDEKEAIAKAKVKLRLASGNIGVLAAVNETVEDSQLLNFILIMVAYFALSTYTFRTIKCPLLLSVPLNMSNLITLAIMYFMGIGLNINTLPIVSLGIGVGDDYGLYIYSRIVEEYDKHKNYKDAFNVALKTSGKAVFFTASTMGFATILWYFISDLRFMAEMGLLLAFIMGLNMVLAMTVIPTLIFVFKHRPRYVYSEKK